MGGGGVIDKRCSGIMESRHVLKRRRNRDGKKDTGLLFVSSRCCNWTATGVRISVWSCDHQ